MNKHRFLRYVLFLLVTDESDFLLRDEKAETQFNFNLQESLRRMREKNIFQVLSLTPLIM